jgi:cellulose synthase (UDP-forming)
VDAVHAGAMQIPKRSKYAAPRWLDASKPAEIGTYTTAERLKLKGSGSINLYFRIPPDLFLQARDSVPLLLKFSYAGVGENADAALHIRLNDHDVDSIRLKPASSTVNEQEIVRLPTGRMQPYTNTITIDVDFGHAGAPTNVWQFAAIHQDSTVDLSGLPHSVILPRLELFADSGYPFTVWPDLSRTAIVLSNAPDASEYETLLDTMGFFGAQTGAPATKVTIVDPSQVEEARDKDLILLGTSQSQPLLSNWASSMPLDAVHGLQLNAEPSPSRIWHPEWPFRNSDRGRLSRLLESGRSPDLVVEDFVSPLREDRSVIALVPQRPEGIDAIAAMFTPAMDKGPIYGGVAVAENGRFQSFLVGDLAYHFGHLEPIQQAQVFLFEHYLLIPLLVIFLAFLIATWLYEATERAAARRLAIGRS